MRRGRLIIILILVLVAIAALVFVYSQGLLTGGKPQEELPTPTPEITTIDVVVITQKVARGTKLTADVLGTVPIQEELRLDGMFTDITEVEGQVTKFDLDSGILLTANMLAATSSQLSRTGSDAALLIPKGKVAISIPISRLSSISYAPRRGDHVNIIVNLMLADMDTSFQSILPNNTAAIIAPGPAALIGLGQQTATQSSSLNDIEGGQASSGATQQTAISAQVADLGEFGRTMNAQVVAGGAASPEGRTSADPLLEETFYLVPSEPQRPRLVSQTLVEDVIVLQVGTFALPWEEEAEKEKEVAVVATTGETTTAEGEAAGGLGALGGTTAEAEPTEEPAVTKNPYPPDIITLIVSPQQAVALNYLIYAGAELTLALRSPEDDGALYNTDAVTLQYLLDVYRIPVPVKLPYGMQPRVDELIAPELANDSRLPDPTPVP